jgi:YggT family protein
MSSFGYVIYLVLSVYAWLIVARSVLSWVRPRPGSFLARLERGLVSLTEPYLALFRRLLPRARVGAAGIDLSPVVALVVLLVAMQILARL